MDGTSLTLCCSTKSASRVSSRRQAPLHCDTGVVDRPASLLGLELLGVCRPHEREGSDNSAVQRESGFVVVIEDQLQIEHHQH